jgi:hypothetical protein
MIRRALRGVGLWSATALALACDAKLPASPTPIASASVPAAAPPSPGRSITISGTVWAHKEGGLEPLGGGQTWAWLDYGGGSGHTSGPIPIDEDGRYTLLVPHGVRLSFFGRPEYQVCVASVTASQDAQLDHHRVLDVHQLGAKIPEVLRRMEPLLTGVVYEATPGGRRPVAGARVMLDGLGGMGLPVAETRTDADGRYVLCAVPDSPELWLDASAPGYATAGAGAVGKSTLDLALTRQ